MIGSSSEKLVLVPYKKGYRLRQFSLLMFFSVGAAVGGFYFGEYQLKLRHTAVVEERDLLRAELSQRDQVLSELSAKLAIVQRGQAVDQQANIGVQQTIKDLESSVSQLREDVTFYKSIMAPSSDTKGLQVQKLEITKVRDENKYSYKLVLAQVSDNKNYVDGVVAVNFIGTKNGEPEILALRDISQETELGIKFRFRYFQNMEGELTIPEGFVPEKVQVVAQSKGKKSTKVDETFSWETGGNGVYVGQKS
jgi:hypothetical protein